MRRQIFGSSGGAVDGAWTDMVIVAPWTAAAAPNQPQYMKDSRNVVHLRGTIVGGAGVAGGTQVWVPPAGFLPGGTNYLRYAPGHTPANTMVAVGSGWFVAGYDGAGSAEAAPASNVTLGGLAYLGEA